MATRLTLLGLFRHRLVGEDGGGSRDLLLVRLGLLGLRRGCAGLGVGGLGLGRLGGGLGGGSVALALLVLLVLRLRGRLLGGLLGSLLGLAVVSFDDEVVLPMA